MIYHVISRNIINCVIIGQSTFLAPLAPLLSESAGMVILCDVDDGLLRGAGGRRDGRRQVWVVGLVETAALHADRLLPVHSRAVAGVVAGVVVHLYCWLIPG